MDHTLSCATPPVRSAEADRRSSCAFADLVASLSIQRYKLLCPKDLNYRQTVLATILVQENEDAEPRVVALGMFILEYTLLSIPLNLYKITNALAVRCLLFPRFPSMQSTHLISSFYP